MSNDECPDVSALGGPVPRGSSFVRLMFAICIVALLAPFVIRHSSFAADATLVSVRKIWDAAPHNAFTDLARFKGEWFCVFREGQKHVSPDGALRVLVSKDGETWTSAALITSTNADLRDAKITVTPAGELMQRRRRAAPAGGSETPLAGVVLQRRSDVERPRRHRRAESMALADDLASRHGLQRGLRHGGRKVRAPLHQPGRTRLPPARSAAV